MTLKLNDSYVKPFISDDAYAAIQPEISAAHRTLLEGSGAGSDFLGWVTLPDDYDREEFARIKAAAEKIKKSCDVFILVGIGVCYLGARATLEYR